MDEISVAWLAGFLEGEGSFTCVPKTNGCISLQITFQTTDEDVAIKAAALMGAKSMGPYDRSGRARKPYWAVRRSGDQAAEVMERLLPHMGGRRTAQIAAALSKWRNRIDKRRRHHMPLYQSAMISARMQVPGI